MKPRVGRILTAIGAGLGVLAAVSMVLKLKMTLTPGMQEVLVYRELFAASAVIIVLGAIIGRRENAERAAGMESGRELGGPSEPPVEVNQRKKELEER